MGADAELALRDIERDPLREKFDYVLCLNLLHHLKSPIAVLDNMIESTNENLVLEVASLGRHDRGKLKLSWWKQRVLSTLPVMYVSRNGTRGPVRCRSSSSRRRHWSICSSIIAECLRD